MDAKRLSLDQVCAMLGRSRATVYAYLRSGRLTARTDAAGLRYFAAADVRILAANLPSIGRPLVYIRS